MFEYSRSPVGGRSLASPLLFDGSGVEAVVDESAGVWPYEAVVAAEADAVDVRCELVDAVDRFSRVGKPVDGLRRSFVGAA